MDCNPEKIKLWTVLEVEENLKKQGFGENITSILKGKKNSILNFGNTMAITRNITVFFYFFYRQRDRRRSSFTT